MDREKKGITSAILPTIPPAAPALKSPGSESSPGPVITTSTPTFEWTEVNRATDYGIYVRGLTANILVFNSQELGIEVTESSFSLPSGILKPGRHYMWSMKSHNSAGWGVFATLLHFLT